MTYSAEIERARYSQQLAEYTLRQISSSSLSLDNVKLPPNQSHRLAAVLGKTSIPSSTSHSSSVYRTSRSPAEHTRHTVKA